MSSTNIQIAVKVRPLVERELREKLEPSWLVKANSIVQIDSEQNFLGEPYSFDHIFDQNTTNKELYDAVVKPLVSSCLEGINSTIFAYGQTSSGKTHTMLGDKDIPGIIVYTVQDIFKHIEETSTKNFLLRCSYLEIYNEKINDLLDTNAKDLKIREDYEQMVHVNAREEVIGQASELFTIMKRGMKTRKIGCTDMNERSSRSHTIFKLVIQSQNKDSEGSYTESYLSLVDLAGSERVGQMKMKAERQVEGVSINKSLTTLGLVIRRLSENEKFINYRDSKLTRLLQHSLGGNSKTLIICTITVAAAEETKSTLEFAQRAKYVKNSPIINEKVTDKDQLKQYSHLCQDYKSQIEKLRLEKQERDKTINALEDKINNIRIFSSGKLEKVSNTPLRRHTLGYFKPFTTKALTTIIDREVAEDSNEEDDSDKEDLPVRSDESFTTTGDENKENINFDAGLLASTPCKTPTAQKTPKVQKIPSPVLILPKGPSEDSSDSLNTFTNYEKQLLGHYDEIKELKDLTDRLRNENIDLRQRFMKETQTNTKIEERNDEVFDQLVLLRSILEGTPVEEVRRKSLHTITEEDFEMLSDERDPASSVEILDKLNEEVKKNSEANEKCGFLSDENEILKQQLKDKEDIISSLNARYTEEKEKMAAECLTVSTKNEDLLGQVEIKNRKIKELEVCISQQNNIKEAELEILTKKVILLNDYKEEMHKQLSELKQSKKGSLKDKYDQTQNTSLPNELEAARKELDELKQLTEYDTFKIGDLEEENLRLKAELEAEKGLEKEFDALREQLRETLLKVDRLQQQNDALNIQLRKYDAEMNQYSILEKENNQLKSELDDVAFQLNGEQKEVENMSQQLESLENQNLELKSQIERLSRDNKCFCGRQQELEQKIADTLKDLEQTTNSYNNLKVSMNQQLEEKSLIITSLEKEITDLEGTVNLLKLEREKLQEFSNMNINLHEASSRKEEEIKTLELKCKVLEQECFSAKNQLQETTVKLNEKGEELDKLLVDKGRLKSHVSELETQVERVSHDNRCSYDRQRELEQKIADMLKELDERTKCYIILKEKCTSQDGELENYKEHLNNKIVELDEKSELYNNILTNYAAKNAEIESLETENEDLKRKLDELYSEQIENANFHQLLEQRYDDINKVKKDNLELQHYLDSNASLQEKLDQYVLDIKSLKDERNSLKIELSNLKNQNECLIKGKAELKDELSQKHLVLEAMREEVERQEMESSYVKQQVNELSKDKIEMNLQLTELTANLNTKQQEIKELKEELERQAEKMNAVEKDRAQLTEKIKVSLKDLLDMKRHSDKRSEGLSHLKGKYNALEVQFHGCKDALKAKTQELNDHLKKTEYLRSLMGNNANNSESLSLEKYTELKSKLRSMMVELDQARSENKLKAVELKAAFEEIQRLKSTISDIPTLQAELEQHKSKLQKIHNNYGENISLLRSTMSKLADEKQVLEKKLHKSDDRVTLLEQMINTQRSEHDHHLKQELYTCKETASALESQLNLEKIKVESLSRKLQQNESDIDNLQAKINELIPYKKRMQEKISDGALKEMHLPRLSDEGRPLSPNDLRKIKRQSLHDQRRGLLVDSSDSLDLADTDCPDCEDFRNKFKRIVEKNQRLLGDMEEIRKNNDYLKWENEYMTERTREMDCKIQELQNNTHGTADTIINCDDCKKMKTKLTTVEEQNGKLKKEMGDLKEENAFLDKENEDMLKIIKEMEKTENDLRDQLQDCKKSTDGSSTGDDQVHLLQINYNEVASRKAELEKELLQNRKTVMECKRKITEMESNYLETEFKQDKAVKDLRRKLEDYKNKMRRTLPSTEDKETQATCELHERYKKVKKLAQIRRQEGNYLRAKLNLPPDCAVLPEDVQRQPTNV